ncbi:MAG: hypothetical protein ABI442_20975 [Gemmatimonadaceae bacterium]
MKRITLAGGVLAILSAACVHSNTMASSAGDLQAHHAMDTSVLPGGAILEGTLDRSMTAANARVGDAFSITLANDTKTKRNATVIPAGAVVYGHVVALDLNNNSGAVATAKLAFDSLVYTGHHHIIDANISKIGYNHVMVRPVDSKTTAGPATATSLTLISFTDPDGQLPAGSPVTLLVTNPIQLEPK